MLLLRELKILWSHEDEIFLNILHPRICWENMGIIPMLGSHILSIMTKGCVTYDNILIMEIIFFDEIWLKYYDIN